MHQLTSVGWTILLLCFTGSLCETFRIKYFYKDTGRYNCNKTYQTVDARSELVCARLCKQSSTYKSFRFWDERKKCYLSDTILCNTEDAYYERGVRPTTESTKRNCTLFPTYLLNTEFSVCYRVVTMSAQRAAAMTDCRNDHPSAHMITLLSTSMMDFFTSAVGGDFWIDGDYQFQTWDNEPMPWESWKDSVRPIMAIGDAITIHKGDRVMKKERDTGSKRYVCEID